MRSYIRRGRHYELLSSNRKHQRETSLPHKKAQKYARSVIKLKNMNAEVLIQLIYLKTTDPDIYTSSFIQTAHEIDLFYVVEV